MFPCNVLVLYVHVAPRCPIHFVFAHLYCLGDVFWIWVTANVTSVLYTCVHVFLEYIYMCYIHVYMYFLSTCKSHYYA